MAAETGIKVKALDELGEATRASDVIVTYTRAKEPGRRSPDEMCAFDSTGTGIQNVAAASRAYELARVRPVGLVCALS
jgi:ornithine cyclodeaminase/alanine dehydrogenase-like protein (mu-crystallin family)